MYLLICLPLRNIDSFVIYLLGPMNISCSESINHSNIVQSSLVWWSAVQCEVWCRALLGTPNVPPDCTAALNMGWRLASQRPTEQCYPRCSPDMTSNVFDNINNKVLNILTWSLTDRRTHHSGVCHFIDTLYTLYYTLTTFLTYPV